MVTMSLGIGGVETHIKELASELVRRGHRVTVASAGGVYVPELEAAGVSHLTLPLASRSPLGLIKAYYGLKRAIKEAGKRSDRFDVVHAHARIPCFICGLLRRSLRFHYVTTVHGVYSMIPGAKALTDWGDRSLAVSDDVKSYLVDSYGIKAENIAITVNGIDVDSFAPQSDPDHRRSMAQELGLDPDCRRRIMHVSRLDSASSDAAYQLIEAMPEIAARYPDAEAVIIGAGTELEAVRAKAEAQNRTIGREAVVMLGARSDIPRLLPCGDIFVGVSRAALEAMSCGLPTVLAGAQGFLGVFDDSEETLISAQKTNFCCRDCEPSTAAAVRDAILTLLETDESRLADFAANGREVVRRYYSVSRMAQDAENMYEDASL